MSEQRKLGPSTVSERLGMMVAAVQARETIDKELGDLMEKLALGDDGVIPAIHTRLLALGRIDQADRIARLMAPAAGQANGR